MSRPEWITDASGKITGYKTPGGADTVFPFINKLVINRISENIGSDATAQGNYSIDVSKYKQMTIGSIVCTGKFAVLAIFDGNKNLNKQFSVGTNKVNEIYDITDCSTINFTLTCQNGTVTLQNVVFE